MAYPKVGWNLFFQFFEVTNVELLGGEVILLVAGEIGPSFFFCELRQYRGQYEFQTQTSRIIPGKYLKFTIPWHSFIPPKQVIQ